MNDGTFAVRYDKVTKAVSLASVLILASIVIFSRNAIAALIAIAVVAVAYAFSPRGYSISGGVLRIKRFAGDVTIPLDDLRNARIAESNDFTGCVRLFGSGGLFGYYGRFKTRALGQCTWYVTDRSKALILATSAKTVVLSPEDREGFLAAVGPFLPSGTSVEIIPAPDALQSRFNFNFVTAGLALGALAALIAAAAMLYSPGPPAVDLTPTALAIHDRFYPVTLDASQIDAANVRVVDYSTESEWRPTLRVNGFGNAFYRSGFFRVASGKIVRLYSARATRLVLLPSKGDGTPVLLEAADPERFAAQARQEWGTL